MVENFENTEILEWGANFAVIVAFWLYGQVMSFYHCRVVGKGTLWFEHEHIILL